MTVPSAYAIRSFVNDVEVTDYAPYDKITLEDYRRNPSKLTMVLENPGFVPEKDMEVFVYNPDIADAPTVFLGYIVDVEDGKRDDGIAPEYRIECADRKIRLLKTVVPFDEYTGLDTDILDDLLANAFPDLSSIYDFSNAVNLADNLDLPVNDDNLLDLLEDLAEQAGADYNFSPGGAPGPVLITFDSGGWGTELAFLSAGIGWHIYEAFLITGGISASGNPGNCARWVDHPSLNSITNGATIGMLEVNLGGQFRITEIRFDYRVAGSSNIKVFEGVTSQESAIAGVGAWHTAVFTLDNLTETPKVGFLASATINTSILDIDLRIDNLQITATSTVPYTEPKDTLNWDSSPPSAAFDLDIDAGDEYGAGFYLETGGWDDYNAVIVTGGSENIAKDWTYHGNIYQEHYPLETDFQDIAVYRNSGSDATPAWGSALVLGYWGVDELLDDGGTKEVLYDKANHWLVFDSSKIPATLNRAFRVTGTIKKPIRVLVENYPPGAVVYATSIYDKNATTPEAAANIGFAFLEEQNAIVRLNFSTLHPGLKVGHAIHVTDSARGLDESTVIQQISTKWIGASGHAEFAVECGTDEGSDTGSLIAANDKRSREKAVPVPIGLTTASLLVDRNGNILTDRNGSQLYEIA